MIKRKISPEDISVVVGRSDGIGEIRINNYEKPFLFKEAEALREQILNNQAVINEIDDQLKDLEQYQPQIRVRAEGILDMRDTVDKIRDREYHLLKFVRSKIYSKLGGKK